MNVKDELLAILLDNQERGISGSELSGRIGCSRMAISKGAAALQKEGYRIEISRGGGYRLDRSDVLSQQVLSRLFSIPVYYRAVCRSTMLEAKDLANRGIEAPFAVVAARQESGRGRLGRSFFSPEGGVYMSIVLPGASIPSPDMLTTAASMAVARAIESLTGFDCAIKWVNDIYVDGRKAVGILTEGIVNMEEGGLDKAIVGIGVNLWQGSEPIPPDLEKKMMYLYPDGDSPVTRAELAAAECREVMNILGEEFIGEYRKRCFIIGCDITVIKNGVSRAARALDVDNRAHLVVRYPDGTEEALSSGEVTLRI